MGRRNKMSIKAAEKQFVLSTEILDTSILESEVLDFIQLISDQDNKEISYKFGFNCETEDIWEVKDTTLEQLKDIFTKAVANKVIDLGYSDFFVYGERWEFQLCNDSDLHFRASSKDGLKFVKEHWSKKGFKLFEEQLLNERI